jgi:hypothetical protein
VLYAAIAMGCVVFAIFLFGGIRGGFHHQQLTPTYFWGLTAAIVNLLLGLASFWYLFLAVFEVERIDPAGLKNPTVKFVHGGIRPLPRSNPRWRRKVFLLNPVNEEGPLQPAILSVWLSQRFIIVVPLALLTGGQR